jgi:hypothetical protein
MASIVPTGGLHPVAGGQTSSSAKESIGDSLRHACGGLIQIIAEAAITAAANELGKQKPRMD